MHPSKTARLHLALFLGLVATLSGQTASAPPGTENTQGGSTEEPVKMSQFIVQTTAGLGYVDANSASGFKTNQSLLDIPQANLVLTQDFIKDIPQLYDNDLLAYAGVASYYTNFGPMIRGSRVGNALLDGMQQAQTADNFFDNYYIDSMEILKGTAAVLYQGGGTTGVIVYSTKKPLPFQQDTVLAETNSFGLVRGALDFTGPIGTLGEAKIGYRVVAGWQNGGQFFVGHNVELLDLHPTFEVDYKNTKVIAAYDIEASQRAQDSNGFTTITGHLYDLEPWKYQDNMPPGMDKINDEAAAFRLYLNQKFSENWEMNMSAIYSPSAYSGVTGFGDHIDWNLGEFVGDWIYESNRVNLWQLVDDVTGRYKIGPIPCQNTFGFAHSQSTTINQSRSDPYEPTYTVPISPGMGAIIASLPAPTPAAGDFPLGANPGQRSVAYQDNIYFEEQVDIVPRWLSVIAGWAFVSTESINDSNIANNTPYSATDESSHFFIPRLGAVLHVTKEISVYALDSQNASLNGALDYYGNRLPSVKITSKEIGVKTSLLDGHVVIDAAAFDTTQTNQAVFAGQINYYGNTNGYSAPIGSTSNRGWDSSLAIAPLPGLQAILTAYRGTVENQAGVWAAPSFGNMWSAVLRYDFQPGTVLHGIDFGTGWNRAGERYLSSGGLTFPAGYPAPSRIRLQEGTNSIAFIDYKISKNWTANLTLNNLLDQDFPDTAQVGEEADVSLPFNVIFRLSYTF